jgi:hypothetical protein
MKHTSLSIFGSVLLLFLCNSVSAALLDFTDNSVGYTGTVDGVGYTLTSTGGAMNRDEQPGTGCGVLACDNDGVGAYGGDNDEIDSDQSLSLDFASPVYVTGLHFLDLFKIEQVKVVIDGGTPFYLDAVFDIGVGGGYLNYIFTTPILASQIEFFAEFSTGDQGDNNFALAGVNVSAIPLPPAVWLFGSALVGLISFRRRGA